MRYINFCLRKDEKSYTGKTIFESRKIEEVIFHSSAEFHVKFGTLPKYAAIVCPTQESGFLELNRATWILVSDAYGEIVGFFIRFLLMTQAEKTARSGYPLSMVRREIGRYYAFLSFKLGDSNQYFFNEKFAHRTFWNKIKGE